MGKVREIRVQSMAELVQHTCAIRDEWIEGPAYFDPWFRGQRRATWALEPNIFRLELWSQEDEIRSEFARRAPQYSLEGVPHDNWGWYFLMQHYGAPTRLLDWTDSVLVALFFALHDEQKDPKDRQDAAVWMLDPWWLNRTVLGVDATLLQKSPRADRYLADPYKNLDSSGGTVVGPEYPIAIDPPFLARRLAVQRSHFTVFGWARDGLMRLAEGEGARVVRINLARHALPRMRADLLTAGVSDTTIYPDLSGLASELTRYHMGNWPPD